MLGKPSGMRGKKASLETRKRQSDSWNGSTTMFKPGYDRRRVKRGRPADILAYISKKEIERDALEVQSALSRRDGYAKSAKTLTGRKADLATRKRMSESAKKRPPILDSTREKLRYASTGRKLSQKQIENLKEASKKDFTCNECGKVCHGSGPFGRHLRYHRDRPPCPSARAYSRYGCRCEGCRLAFAIARGTRSQRLRKSTD